MGQLDNRLISEGLIDHQHGKEMKRREEDEAFEMAIFGNWNSLIKTEERFKELRSQGYLHENCRVCSRDTENNCILLDEEYCPYTGLEIYEGELHKSETPQSKRRYKSIKWESE